MKKNAIYGLLLLLFPVASFSAGEANQLESGLVNPGYHEKPAWFKDSFLDINEDIAEANEADKRLILYFYQDGCPYCSKLLQDNFGNQAISDKTQRYFDLIAINMWGDREVVVLDGVVMTEKAFAQSLKVQYTPTLLLLNEAGEVLVRINGYFEPHNFDAVLDYVAQKKEHEMSVREYIASVNPQPAAGKLHQQEGFLKHPIDLSLLDANKPVLILFEQKACASCDELHLDIFQRDAVRTSLEQFQVALLDIWSNEAIIDFDGNETTTTKLATSYGVQYAPSLLFFAAGQEVFRTEAYLKAFHIHGALDYVVDQAYTKQTEFQRYLQDRRAEYEARGVKVDLWE